MSEKIKFPRRSFLAIAAVTTIAVQLVMTGCADTPSEKAKPARQILFDYDGSKEPFPIPWLDANGSHNQMPGIRQEPSHIYHFKGLVARCNGFVGKGTDQDGNPVPFGTKTTDFGIMMGEHYTGRTVHKVALVHL